MHRKRTALSACAIAALMSGWMFAGLPARAEAPKLVIEVQGSGAIAIEAVEVSPNLLFTSLSEALGFTVAWTGMPLEAPRISGQFQGPLTELLPRLLPKRSYVAVMDQDRLARLVVTSTQTRKAVVERLPARVDDGGNAAAPSAAFRLALGFGRQQDATAATGGSAAPASSPAVPIEPVVRYEIPPGTLAGMLEGLSLQAGGVEKAKQGMVPSLVQSVVSAKAGQPGITQPGITQPGITQPGVARRSLPPHYGAAGKLTTPAVPSAKLASAAAASPLGALSQQQAAALASATAKARLGLKALVAGLKSTCRGDGC